MPKFYQKNGLTEYALSCGYIQTIKHDEKEVQLYKDGCYHVRTFDREDGTRLWECFDSIADARKYWEREVRRAFNPLLKFISMDRRYTFASEHTGNGYGAKYVVRFCGDWVGEAETIYGAKMVAYVNKITRTGNN